jgi:hypothetical protein
MARESGKKQNLAVHLDKIAYGAAGLVALVIFLIPLLSTRGISRAITDLEGERQRVDGLQGTTPPPVEVPKIKDALEKQWAAPAPLAAEWISPWSIEARPGIVKLIQTRGPDVAQHEPGKILKISCLRSKERRQPYLRVEAERGPSKLVKFAKTKLLRQELPKAGAPAADAKFVEVADLTKSLACDDYGVEPGKLYQYKLVTEAAADGDPQKVKLKDEDRVKESPVLAMKAAVPFDYAVQIVIASGFDAQNNKPAYLNGTFSYWDYPAAKVEKKTKTAWIETNTFGPKLGEEERYRISRIEDNKVSIKDTWGPLKKPETLTAATGKRLVEAPPEVVFEVAATPPVGDEPVAKVVDDTEGKKDAKKDEDENGAETPKKKPAAPKDTGKSKPKKDTGAKKREVK